MDQRLAEDEDEADQCRVALLHAKDTLPFVAAPEDVAEAILTWRRVLSKEGTPPLRFKPVVIDGRTRCGKSQWAENVFGTNRTLMVNCQGVQEPPLRHFRRNMHDAIVFETSSMSCANGGASSDKSFSILLLIRLRRSSPSLMTPTLLASPRQLLPGGGPTSRNSRRICRSRKIRASGNVCLARVSMWPTFRRN